jgi:hypothetical protein
MRLASCSPFPLALKLIEKLPNVRVEIKSYWAQLSIL